MRNTSTAAPDASNMRGMRDIRVGLAQIAPRLGDLEARLAGEESSRGELEARLEAAEAGRAEIEGRLEAAEASGAELESRMAEARAAREELDGRLSEAEAARAELEAVGVYDELIERVAHARGDPGRVLDRADPGAILAGRKLRVRELLLHGSTPLAEHDTRRVGCGLFL